jgi:hypothetical protein
MSQHGLGAPPELHSSVDPTALLVIWSVMAGAAVVAAIVLARRDRTALPVVACAGALVCALNEPIYDILGNIVYADTPAVAYHAFGRAIPWTLPIGYVPWVGLMPYVLYRLMRGGSSRATLHRIAAGLIASVAVLEVLNAVWWHNWKYYGEAPARSLLSGGVVQMAAMPLLCALLYLLFADRLRGWRRAALGLLCPSLALPMVFASTTWPLYISNHALLPAAVDWLCAAVTIVLALGAVPVITWLAVTLRATPGPGPVPASGSNWFGLSERIRPTGWGGASSAGRTLVPRRQRSRG